MPVQKTNKIKWDDDFEQKWSRSEYRPNELSYTINIWPRKDLFGLSSENAELRREFQLDISAFVDKSRVAIQLNNLNMPPDLVLYKKMAEYIEKNCNHITLQDIFSGNIVTKFIKQLSK
jgi:hypothetical protein